MDKFEQSEILDRVRRNLVGLQRDIVRNKEIHLAMLAAGSPPQDTLQRFVLDCVATYDQRLKWVEDFLADEAMRDAIDNSLVVAGFTEQDIRAKTAVLREQVDAMAACGPDFVAALDTITIKSPPSLWPE